MAIEMNQPFVLSPDPQMPVLNTVQQNGRGMLVLLFFFGLYILSFVCFGIFGWFFVFPKALIIMNKQKSGINRPVSPMPPRPSSSPLGNSVPSFSEVSQKTNLLWKQGNYQDALLSAGQLLRLANTKEEKAIAYYWEGVSAYKLGQKEKAEFTLRQALVDNPNYAAPYVTLSAIQMEKGNYPELLILAQKCVEIDTTYVWCHNNLGLGYLLTGQRQKGIEELQKAVALDPQTLVFADNLNRALQSK